MIALSVEFGRTYIGNGLTRRNFNRPGLHQALAALRAGDMLVVPKPGRLARSVPNVCIIADGLAARQIKLVPGMTLNDPVDRPPNPRTPQVLLSATLSEREDLHGR